MWYLYSLTCGICVFQHVVYMVYVAMLVMLDLDLKLVIIYDDHALMFPYVLYMFSMHVLRGSIS